MLTRQEIEALLARLLVEVREAPTSDLLTLAEKEICNAHVSAVDFLDRRGFAHAMGRLLAYLELGGYKSIWQTAAYLYDSA